MWAKEWHQLHEARGTGAGMTKFDDPGCCECCQLVGLGAGERLCNGQATDVRR